MASFLNAVFGGSENKSTSKSSSESWSYDMTPKPFRGLQGPLAGTLGGAFANASDVLNSNYAGSGGSFGAPGPSGTFEAATTETPEAQQIRTQGLLPEALGNPDGRGSYTADVISGKYLPGQEGANPFYDAFYQASARPFTQEYEETVGRLLPSRFLAAGHLADSNNPTDGGSSAFDRARAIATRGYAQSLSDLASKLGFQTYEAERGRQQEAVQLSQADTDLMIKNYEAQLMPTFIAQYGVEAGLKEYQTRVTAALEILKTAAQVTQPTIGQASKSSSSATSSGESTGGIVPGIGSILSVNR